MKGGIRKRLGLSKPKVPNVPIRSDPLCNEAMDLYGSGILSAGHVGSLVEKSLHSSASAGASSSTAAAPPPPPPPSSTPRTRLARAKPHAGQGSRATTRNSSRALKRQLLQESCLPDTYDADIISWDCDRDCKSTQKVSFLPVHEVLDAVVAEGEELDWCSFDDNQQGFRRAMEDWGARVGVATAFMTNMLAISLWGDSAPFNKVDSLFLQYFNVLSGKCRHRLWITAFSKKILCRCLGVSC